MQERIVVRPSASHWQMCYVWAGFQGMPGGQMRQARPAQPHVRAASNARPITGKISMLQFCSCVYAEMLYSCITVDFFSSLLYWPDRRRSWSVFITLPKIVLVIKQPGYNPEIFRLSSGCFCVTCDSQESAVGGGWSISVVVLSQ